MTKRNFNADEIPQKHRKLKLSTINERLSMILLGIANAKGDYDFEKGAYESTIQIGTVQLKDETEAIIEVKILADSYTVTVEESTIDSKGSKTGESYEIKMDGHDLSQFPDRKILVFDLFNKAKKIDYFFFFDKVQLGTIVSSNGREVGLTVALIPEFEN